MDSMSCEIDLVYKKKSGGKQQNHFRDWPELREKP